MTYSSKIKRPSHVPFVVGLNSPIFRDGRSYVPEPYFLEEKHDIWFSKVLIPYSTVGTIHDFMGHLLRPSKKPSNF